MSHQKNIDMNEKEIKQLMDLAKKLKKEVTKDSAKATFVAAGILNSHGDFTPQYKNLQGIL